MSRSYDNHVRNFLSRSPNFRDKSEPLQELICETLAILDTLGIPLDNMTPRRQERMALAFLAVIGKRVENSWSDIQDLSDSVSLKTRDIITILNREYEEDISSGSYDDIRRKDLRLLVLGEIIVPSNPHSAHNDSRRGYALNPVYTDILKQRDVLSDMQWEREVIQNFQTTLSVKDMLSSTRNLSRMPVILPSGEEITFSPGEHNQLQRAIIEEFLPRYGHGCEVLYVGDAANRLLYKNEVTLRKINFFELSHGELPDIVAYSEQKNWLYLIEAVHSSGPITDVRLVELKRLTSLCTAEIIYVTAFLTRATFQKFVKEIAWETEIWIAESPDHVIHFDGDKFLGPYL